VRKGFITAVIAGVAVAVSAASAAADVRVTDRPYVRHDGGTDATIASCSSDAPGTTGGGERQQNEPTAAVDPLDTMKLTAGANDYCAVPTGGDAWAGFYYSPDGGANWVDSLLPGYPNDTSPEGQASPLFGLVGGAGDPVQDWDRANHLYYGGIAFNRAKPTNASIWVARYNWSPPFVTPKYEFTSIVSQGTPSPFLLGHFEDKVELEADDGTASPFAGNVYVCWARFTSSAHNNFVEFARSTDGGHTWQRQKISEGVHGSQDCDVAVTRTGTVFVTWRQFQAGKQQPTAIAWVKSTDGGASFTKPAVAQEFIPWDPQDEAASPVAAGFAHYQACLAADDGPDACAGPEPEQLSGDCGDGPFTCRSGYVFGRDGSAPRNAADPVAGEGDELYVVVEATVPGTQRPSGTTYGTIDPGVASQGAIYFTKTENGGRTWSALTRIDAQARGNQIFPDIDANAGKLHVMWQDTRASTGTGPDGSFFTVPFENQWVAANPPGGVLSNPAGGVQSVYSTSTNGGGTWTSITTTAPYRLHWEQFGGRDLPFFGDYNYISAVGGKVLFTWTDGRDTVAGVDPRYTNGDGTDGFDVLQCRTQNPDGSFSGDTCPNAGGLDQNIWATVIG
jgi:photosystem II stability/assembly factor-like uncharacterized protein